MNVWKKRIRNMNKEMISYGLMDKNEIEQAN